MPMREVEREGVAVDLETAIKVFREHMDPSAVRSGRMFDEDLGRRDLAFLDIGCGLGKYLMILRNNGIRKVVGFDIMGDMVDIAHKEFGLKNVFVANALNIPVADRTFDRILMYNVIEHLSEPTSALKEIHRVLSDQGIVYLDAPNARSMGDRLFRWGGKILYGKTSHIQKFTKVTLDALVSSMGFRVLDCREFRGIYIDYPQMRYFPMLKKILRLLFDREVNSWEMKLEKR
jgi:ubiquinone/menaquinone biosynthesis C-methylase UbiE